MRLRDTTRERSITILNHAMENTVVSTVNATYVHDGKFGCNTKTVDSIEGAL